MAVSLTWSTSVSNTSDTAATVSVTLKAKSTNGSYNNNSKSGWIKIDGTKYTFSHSFKKNTTTTLATKSKSVSRTTASRSISISASYTTGVSSGTVTKSGSVTVSARPLYTVTFNANGGSGGKSVSVYSGYTTTFPYTSRTGYTFGSWNGYAQGAATPAITSSRTYTASWTAITYSIGYTLNEGSITGQPTSYTVASAAFTLPKPTREGYYFVGWTGSNGDTPQRDVTIPTGSTGNRSYVANWRLNVYDIIYDFGEGVGEGATWPTDVTPIIEKTHGVEFALPEPKWTGHIFAGWVYNNGTEDINIGLETCPANINGVNDRDDITLTALWSNAVRPVIYHYYRSATDVNSIYQVYKIKDYNINTTLVQPSIDNYVFKGWVDTDRPYDPAQTTIDVLDNFHYDLMNEVTGLTPGDTSVNPKELEYFEYDEDLSSPTYGCYIETEDEAVSEDVNKKYYTLNYGDDEHPAEAINLYATWNKVYTVNYFPNTPAYNDGIEVDIVDSNFKNSIVVEKDVPFTLSSSTAVYKYKDSHNEEKCTASGWAQNRYGTIEYTNEQLVTLSDLEEGYVLNLYAVWTPVQFTLSFDKGIGQSDTGYTITRDYYTTVTLPTDTVDDQKIVTYTDHYITNWKNTEAAYYARVLNPVVENLSIYYEYIEDSESEYYGTYQLTQDVAIMPNKVYYYINDIFNLQEPFLITTDNTFIAQWIESYNVPQIRIYTERYLDPELTTISAAGKYVLIVAEGNNGFWEVGGEVQSSTHTFEISGNFYDDVGVKINETIQSYDNDDFKNFVYELTEDTAVDPTKIYYIKIENEGEYTYEQVVTPVDENIETYYELINGYGKIYKTRVIQDKYFKYYSGEITFKDTSVYPGSADDSDRTYTYRFTIPLKRGIGLHLADDLSAIALLDELQDNDKGLIVQGPISISRLWIWKLDPVTKNMYLEWIGGETDG